MTDVQQRAAAKKFATEWKGKGYEKGESQKFWLELLGDVLGVSNPYHYISFEDQVHLDHTSFIDGFIPATRVLIEQKSIGKDLRKPIKQSDGSLLTPFQQAKRYISELPFDRHPRWVITCNFGEFNIYDMNKPQGDPEVIFLEDLEKEYYRLTFLIDKSNEHIKKELEVSMSAGKVVGMLYDAISKQYHNPESEESSKSLNLLCVRLVFCLYAEDAGIFGRHDMFHDYLSSFESRHFRRALIDLFKVLDTRPEERDPYLDSALAEFPYINGGLFSDTSVEIPQFTDEICDLILNRASMNFDWSQISPTIFGALFESTLNPETRHAGGMHYTSIENIHKVIDPLFLNDLEEEFERITSKIKDIKKLRPNLYKLQDKLASLIFLDPACGSGNFLTETYLSLRRLENRIIACLQDGAASLGYEFSPVKVSIHQFYGIEINDYAGNVAKTALWIAESQMMKQTEDIVQADLNILPLKSYSNIVIDNALRIDWGGVVPMDRLNYIMGNPPFLGHQNRSQSQIEDMNVVFDDFGNYGKLDYVAAWYKKAADLIKGTNIRVSFVSTNSLVQGESVSTIWEPLFNKYGIDIFFAHQSFVWDSDAADKAHVHCVIIGFSSGSVNKTKVLYTSFGQQKVKNINGYLLDAPNVFIKNRSAVMNGMPRMLKGSQPTDGGNLFLSEPERQEFIKKYPETERFIKRFIGADEFINNKVRFCFWLKGVSPSEYRKIPEIQSRLAAIREKRLMSPTLSVQRDADIPMLFTQIRQPDTEYLVVPEVSSERRKYIPFGFMSPEVIVGNACSIIPEVNLFHFGVLISNVHMAWMRVVAGRLKSDYRYTPAVYNNFPWPNPTSEQKERIEKTAQAILDARVIYSDCSLADLYDDMTMPVELRKAHQDNDRAVMAAYGFDVKTMTESSCVAALMALYIGIINKKDN